MRALVTAVSSSSTVIVSLWSMSPGGHSLVSPVPSARVTRCVISSTVTLFEPLQSPPHAGTAVVAVGVGECGAVGVSI